MRQVRAGPGVIPPPAALQGGLPAGEVAAQQPGKQRGVPAALAVSLRPRQWIKNVLVLAAPAAAGVLGQRTALLHALGATAIFCAVAGGAYLWNDSFDIAADRAHPTKKHRPVAAGLISVPLARSVGSILLAGGVGAAMALTGWRLALVVGLYCLITLSYSSYLKGEPVIDLAAVASGFVLRTIAGGVATGVPLSHWFLLVASFASMFVVASKRQADLEDPSIGAEEAQPAEYSVRYLGHVRSVCSAVAIAAYGLWAFQKADATPSGAIYFELSIVPFVLALLRYAYLVDRGMGGAPEVLLLSDRKLEILGVAWAVAFALGVYKV